MNPSLFLICCIILFILHLHVYLLFFKREGVFYIILITNAKAYMLLLFCLHGLWDNNIHWSLIFTSVYYSALYTAIYKGGSRIGAPGARPPFENIFGVVFVNLDCITRIYFNCINHGMCSMCILFFTLTTKAKGMCWGASKQSPDSKKSTALGLHPPVLKFLAPPLI